MQISRKGKVYSSFREAPFLFLLSYFLLIFFPGIVEVEIAEGKP